MAASSKGEYENTIDGGFLWEDKIPVSHLDNLKLNLLDRLSVRRKCKGVLWFDDATNEYTGSI